jgi:acyl transferase domain-containing protein
VAPLLTDGVAIAAVNGPEAVVISGAEGPVDAITQTLSNRGRRFHRLAVSHAFHSPLMEPMIERFEAALAGIAPNEPRIPLVSNVSGQLAGPGYGSAGYWAEHVRRPVRFADGVRAAEASGAGVFVEVGPGGGLSAAAEQSLATEHPVATVTLAKDRAEVESLLVAAGRLFATGVAVDWSAVLAHGRRVELPTYAFVRQKFWLGAGTDASTPAVQDESAERLRQLPPRERRRRLIELVCAHAAAVLGHSDGHAVDPDRAFQDLGFDSLTGVELRNRLKADTGLALSRTLVFDYPNPAALADHLAEQMLRGESAESNDEKIWSALRKIPLNELRRTGLLDKLLLLAGDPEKSLADSTVTDDAIDSLSPDALIALALDANKENDAPG